MIFVTLGTQDKPFTRLLDAIEKEIEQGNITEKVIVQAGCTKYSSKYMEIFDLIDPEEFNKLVKECDLLITHGGVGSILEGMKNNKKIIAVPRLKKHDEHTNDHQLEILNEFSKKEYILYTEKLNDFGKLIKEVKNFQPKTFESNTDNFVNSLKEYIDSDNNVSFLNKYREYLKYGYNGLICNIINIILFSLFLNKYNLILSIIFAYLITLLISYLFKFLMDIKYKIKESIMLKMLTFILDITLMVILSNVFHLSEVLSKIIVFIILSIINIVIINVYKKRTIFN